MTFDIEKAYKTMIEILERKHKVKIIYELKERGEINVLQEKMATGTSCIFKKEQ